ncbi:hypothetical protein [Cryobacterium sp. Hh7]|nr:hypothetical protein [Cryobacterium sp. Hh7]
MPVETSAPTRIETAVATQEPTVPALDGLTDHTAQDDSCAQSFTG